MSGNGTATQATPQEQAAAQVTATPADLFTGFPNAPSAVTIPAGMPGQLPAIAQQLARGFDGSPADFLAYLENIHKPTTYNAYGRGGQGVPADALSSLQGGPGIDLLSFLNIPDMNSMPYEQWNTRQTTPSRVSPSYGGQ